MGFFKEWPIWQKLVFILGCAIVVTVILGCAKLSYTRWKSSTLPEKERIEQALQRQMSQRRRAGSDVPFGIRAIESGIEVDGVWISRPNTPNATRETSIASSKWDQGPRKDFSVDIESQNYPVSAGLGSVSTLHRTVSTERPSSNLTSRNSSPDINMGKPARGRHPPLAYSRYTGNPALQQGSVMDTLEGLEAIYRASGPMDTTGVFDSSTAEERLGSSDSSNKSATDSDPISASAPRLLNSQRTRQQSADLDLRRMSQAAETGQLTPRVRREHAWSTHEQGDYFSPPRKTSDPPMYAGQDSRATRSPTNNVWSSHIGSLPPAVRRSSLPDVTPFTQFCLTAPASPLSRPASPASSIMSGTSGSSSSSRPSAGERTRSQPVANTNATSSATSQPAASLRSAFDKRDSTILRGHGTGFEILQPGTFDIAEQRNAPPISLLNGSSRTRSNSADQSRRKLQKKRRPSAESDSSSRDGFADGH